ncbi:fatty acid desaturase [Sphingomonas floccifaciens]|uniref:Fatty acid desaturase n=1 Tax=Sphingomonas floccifaciens TaxID=1844115 RepID=A0ABW4NAM8_9SPHN
MTSIDARTPISEIIETTDISVRKNLRLTLLRSVPWRDLTPMRRRDGLVECLHPVPWLAAGWAGAVQGWWIPAAAALFMFFLTALRLNHEAIHGNLGFAPRGHRLVIHLLSALMLGSNSAVAVNHLHHHRHVGHADDLEGRCGAMPAWRVLLYGPLFPVEMHRAAWRGGNPTLRRRMTLDLALNGVLVALAIGTGWTFLTFHLTAMVLAQCLTAFFAVWITHHGCEADGAVARTQRAGLINLLTYNMFFHLEHHLFPAVPVKRLGRLAQRLDSVMPALAAGARRVVPSPFR